MPLMLIPDTHPLCLGLHIYQMLGFYMSVGHHRPGMPPKHVWYSPYIRYIVRRDNNHRIVNRFRSVFVSWLYAQPMSCRTNSTLIRSANMSYHWWHIKRGNVPNYPLLYQRIMFYLQTSRYLIFKRKYKEWAEVVNHRRTFNNNTITKRQ